MTTYTIYTSEQDAKIAARTIARQQGAPCGVWLLGHDLWTTWNGEDPETVESAGRDRLSELYRVIHEDDDPTRGQPQP